MATLAWLVPYIIGMLVGIPAIHLQAVCAIGTSVIIVAILAVILFEYQLCRHENPFG